MADWRDALKLGAGIATRNFIHPGTGTRFSQDDDAANGGVRDAAPADVPAKPAEPALPTPNAAAPGGAATDGNALPDLSLSQRQQMAFYGLTESMARRQVITSGGKKFIGEVLADLHSWEPAKVEKLQRQLYRGGFYSTTTKTPSINGRWDADTLDAALGLFDETSRLNASGDPRDWQAFLTEAEQDPARAAESREVILSTEGQARDTLKTAMSDLLGRKPKGSEIRRFQKRLNNAERANPVVTAADVGGADEFDVDVDSTEVQDGGFAEGDADKLAEDEILAENGVEAGAYSIGNTTRIFEQMMLGS